MRNNYLFLMSCLMAGAGLAACSSEKDDPAPAGSDNAIRFTAESRQPQERANSDLTTSNLNQFFVYGFLKSNNQIYMDNVEVNKTSTNTWEYSPLKYWPTGDALNFYAYAPKGMLPSGVTPLEAVPFVNSGTTDFIYAVSPGMTQPAAGTDAQVKFNFRHALAKVTVMLSSEDTNIVVKVNNVTVVGANNSGQFTFPSASTAGDVASADASSIGTWSDLSGKGIAVLHMAQRQDEILTLTSTPIDADTDGTAMDFFIPQDLPFTTGGSFESEVYLQLTCAIYDKATGQKVWPNANTPAVNLPNGGLSGEGYIYLTLQGSNFTAWKPGYHYVYNIAINGHPDMSMIDFGTPTVDSFVTVTTQLQP